MNAYAAGFMVSLYGLTCYWNTYEGQKKNGISTRWCVDMIKEFGNEALWWGPIREEWTTPTKPDTLQPSTGWSSDYYELPEGATELQDLIEHKDMNFSIGNIFKACYRYGIKGQEYDLRKILWYAGRELRRIEREHSGRGSDKKD